MQISEHLMQMRDALIGMAVENEDTVYLDREDAKSFISMLTTAADFVAELETQTCPNLNPAGLPDGVISFVAERKRRKLAHRQMSGGDDAA